MKKLGILFFIAAIAIGLLVTNIFSSAQPSPGPFRSFISFSFGRVNGSGNIVTERRDVTGFKAIEAGGVFEIEVVAQKDFSVEVEGDDNVLQYVETTVSGETFEVRTTKRLSTSKPIKVRITAPSIEDIDVSGVVSVKMSNAKSEKLRVEMSGATKFTADGEVNKLTVDLSGKSDFIAPNLKAVDVNFDASGACRGDIFASGSLNVDLSGASKLEYAGDAKIGERSTSGASKVVAKQ